MSNKRKPNKSRLIRRKSTLTNNKKVNSKDSYSEKDKELAILGLKLRQELIDRYNNCEIYKIDNYFRNFQLQDDSIIVRIMKENYIKEYNGDEDNPVYDAYFRQIDIRERSTDQPEFRDTPFPYIEKGVIVAISSDLQLKMYKKKDDLSKYNKELAEGIDIPKVGDVIEFRSNYSSVWFKNKRYYIDKQEQCIDLVKGPRDWSIPMFDHYYKFEDIDYVGIDRNFKKKGFYVDDKEPEWYKKEIKKHDDNIKQLDIKISNLLESGDIDINNLV